MKGKTAQDYSTGRVGRGVDTKIRKQSGFPAERDSWQKIKLFFFLPWTQTDPLSLSAPTPPSPLPPSPSFAVLKNTHQQKKAHSRVHTREWPTPVRRPFLQPLDGPRARSGRGQRPGGQCGTFGPFLITLQVLAFVTSSLLCSIWLIRKVELAVGRGGCGAHTCVTRCPPGWSPPG